MLHCGGGAGPSNVDWLAVLDRWVTADEAPGALTAGPGSPTDSTPTEGSSQLVCPYPQVAAKGRDGTRRCEVASAPPPPQPPPRLKHGRHP
jgi:hypothetical protein